MKIRNFYPRSAIRKLELKEPSKLSLGERAALKFIMLRGRKYGVSVLCAPVDMQPLYDVTPEQARAIFDNCTTHIQLRGL
jgi:hypothetical protein